MRGGIGAWHMLEGGVFSALGGGGHYVLVAGCCSREETVVGREVGVSGVVSGWTRYYKCCCLVCRVGLCRVTNDSGWPVESVVRVKTKGAYMLYTRELPRALDDEGCIVIGAGRPFQRRDILLSQAIRVPNPSSFIVLQSRTPLFLHR